jgi:hypothetical protein
VQGGDAGLRQVVRGLPAPGSRLAARDRGGRGERGVAGRAASGRCRGAEIPGGARFALSLSGKRAEVEPVLEPKLESASGIESVASTELASSGTTVAKSVSGLSRRACRATRFALARAVRCCSFCSVRKEAGVPNHRELEPAGQLPASEERAAPTGGTRSLSPRLAFESLAWANVRTSVGADVEATRRRAVAPSIARPRWALREFPRVHGAVARNPQFLIAVRAILAPLASPPPHLLKEVSK